MDLVKVRSRSFFAFKIFIYLFICGGGGGGACRAHVGQRTTPRNWISPLWILGLELGSDSAAWVSVSHLMIQIEAPAQVHTSHLLLCLSFFFRLKSHIVLIPLTLRSIFKGFTGLEISTPIHPHVMSRMSV